MYWYFLVLQVRFVGIIFQIQKLRLRKQSDMLVPCAEEVELGFEPWSD